MNLHALDFALDTIALKALSDLFVPMGVPMPMVTSAVNPHATVFFFVEFIHIILEAISTFTCRSASETVGLQALSSVVGFGQLEQQPSP